ncbi:MAG: class I SAM-dependent methyltransferase [Phycisphaerales bacterium]|nr:class I SAM-dependent methyltransferase [Phycisphaerales bacterium]
MTGTPPPPPPPPKKAEHYAATRDWPGYYAAVLGKPPRDTLLAALASFEREGPPGVAVDLACGEGRDTLELLRRGWFVWAIDPEPAAFKHLYARVPPEHDRRLQGVLEDFSADWPDSIDLLNCSFSLPFCPPRDFPAVWEHIVRSIRPGGRFAGQLFGDRDSWAALPDRSHQTRAEAERMLAAFDLEVFREDEKDGNDAGGFTKHWHVFHVVARKKQP